VRVLCCTAALQSYACMSKYSHTHARSRECAETCQLGCGCVEMSQLARTRQQRPSVRAHNAGVATGGAARSLLLEVKHGALRATAAVLRHQLTLNVAQERGMLTVLAPLAATLDAAAPPRGAQATRKAPLEAAYVKVYARTPAGVRACLLHAFSCCLLRAPACSHCTSASGGACMACICSGGGFQRARAHSICATSDTHSDVHCCLLNHPASNGVCAPRCMRGMRGTCGSHTARRPNLLRHTRRSGCADGVAGVQDNFWRDGYTDSLGRFEYAASTSPASSVHRFALLVVSPAHGSTVTLVDAPSSARR
jgi:hypothetical protein